MSALIEVRVNITHTSTVVLTQVLRSDTKMLYVTLHNTPTTVCIFAYKMFTGLKSSVKIPSQSQNQPVFAYLFATHKASCVRKQNCPFINLAQWIVNFPAHVM